MTIHRDRSNVLSLRSTSRRPADFLADDGYELHGTWFRPNEIPIGAVLVAPAMGTPSRFYGEFAAWLADSGFLTLTFDYRGTESVDAIKAERCDLLRWAGDAASALEALISEVTMDTPVTWVGHSLGGQLLPFARHDLLDKAIIVAAGSGYWRLSTGINRRMAPVLWRLLAPLTIKAFGYFPGRRIGVLGDIPANVMRQWGRWCMNSRYLAGEVPNADARYGAVDVPIYAIHFSDDKLVSEASAQAHEDEYVAAPVSARTVTPHDLGVKTLGHTGFFRQGAQMSWTRLIRPQLPTRQMSGV